MKFRSIVLIMEQLLEFVRGEDEETADMFLPERLLSMAFFLIAATAGALCAAVLHAPARGFYLAAAVSFPLGMAAFLCWRNQKICMLNEEEFAYTTMWGKTTIHRFEDIIALNRNRDSYTLILKSGKVHIESMAIVSDRLSRRIADEFERMPAK